MGKQLATFKRGLSQQIMANLKNEPLFVNHLQKDIKAGNVFMAIRNNTVDFYYLGNNLFKFNKNTFQTHYKFASALNLKTNSSYVTQHDLKSASVITDFDAGYHKIKENCKHYAKLEAGGIAELYKNFSYVHCQKDNILLDIEASLAASGTNKSDRIDLVFYHLPSKEIFFVEAKHYSNTAIRASNNNPAKVIGQIQKYESTLKIKEQEVISAYGNYVTTINQLLNLNLPIPNSIKTTVPLLIFGFDRDQQQGRLKTQVTANPIYTSNNILVKAVGNEKSINPNEIWKLIL
jgi:hypothetical protein